MKLHSFLARNQGPQHGLGFGAGSSRSSDEFGRSTGQPREKGRARDLKMKGPAAPDDEGADGKFLGSRSGTPLDKFSTPSILVALLYCCLEKTPLIPESGPVYGGSEG